MTDDEGAGAGEEEEGILDEVVEVGGEHDVEEAVALAGLSHECGEGDVAEAGEGVGAEAFDFALHFLGVEKEAFDDAAVVKGGVSRIIIGELLADPRIEVLAFGSAEVAELGEPVVADELGSGGDAGGDGASGAQEKGIAVVGLFGEAAQAPREFDGGDGAKRFAWLGLGRRC
jgi:hypothetical protein